MIRYMDKRDELTRKYYEASALASQWLHRGNVAIGDDKSEKCYAKAQFWKDRCTAIQDKLYELGYGSLR